MLNRCLVAVFVAMTMAEVGLAQARDSDPGPKVQREFVREPSGRRHLLARAVDEIGYTGRNMVTFRDKKAAFEEWGIILSFYADAYETRQAQHFCRGCQETSPLLGTNPGSFRVFGTELAIGYGFAYLTQKMRDSGGPKGLWAVPALPVIGFELYAAGHNGAIADEWKRCWATPSCAAKYK
jgi:hypothetical protein